MSDKIAVSVIITTYDPGDNTRFPLLYQTIDGLIKNLEYPNLRWVISDDGSPNHDEMMAVVGTKLQNRDLTILNVQRKGVGCSKNSALRDAFQFSPIVLLMEDDWYLDQRLDLLKYVQQMLDHPDIGIVRFGYIGGSTLEAYYRGYSPFDTYWEFKQGSDVYVYSGQVSLRSKVWYDTVGYHDENCSPGEEELAMCIRYNGTPNAPKILWPAEYGTILNAGPFKNIGMGNSLNWIMPE